MTSKPITRKLTSQPYQEPTEQQPISKPQMRPTNAKPKLQLQKQDVMPEQVIVNDELPQPAQTKPVMRVRRAVEPQPDPFGESMEASQVTKLGTSAVVQAKPLKPTLKKGIDFQASEEPAPVQPRASRERVVEEVKPLKPFNITASKFPKMTQQQPVEPVEPEQPVVPKFPEQSGRRTPYNMGPRQKAKQIQEEGPNTSIPVSLLLEQNNAQGGPQMNLFKNKLKHHEETQQMQQEHLRQNMVRTNVTQQNPILIAQDRQVPLSLDELEAPPIKRDEAPQQKRIIKKKQPDQPPQIPDMQAPEPQVARHDAPKVDVVNETRVEATRPEAPSQPQRTKLQDSNPPLQYDGVKREINLAGQQVSAGKLDEQRQRCKDIRALVTLEIEDYGSQFSLQPRTAYDIYISQIQGGSVRNSCDQAYDEALTQETQTDPLGYNDFSNQAPEDLSRTFLLNANQKHEYQTQRLQEFLDAASLVVEEILEYQEDGKPQLDPQFTQAVHLPPLLVKHFNVQSKIVEPYYHGSHLELYQALKVQAKQFPNLWGSLIVVTSSDERQVPKYYYTPQSIQCMTIQSQYIVCGTGEGSLVIWDQKEPTRPSKQLNQLRELLECPTIRNHCYSSELLINLLDSMDQTELHGGSIVTVQFNRRIKIVDELISMDIFGKVIVWQLRELRGEESNRLLEETGARSHVKLMLVNEVVPRTQAKMRTGLVIDDQTLLIYGGSGEVSKANKDGSKKVPPPKHFGESQGGLPTYVTVTESLKFFYVGYQDGVVRLFHKTHPLPVLSIQACPGGIVSILMLNPPSDEPIEDLNRFAVVTRNGMVYFWDLTKSLNEPANKQDLNRDALSERVVVHASYSQRHVNVFLQAKDLTVSQTCLRVEKYCESDTRKLQEDNQMLIDATMGDYKGN